MPTISIAESLLDALADLDRADVRRVAAFLEKLVLAPETSSLRPEIVHDAADRAVRSFKVTRHLRAIARIEGDQVLVLYAGQHDRAYAWARDRCITCHPATAELLVLPVGDESGGGTPMRPHLCSTTRDLCRILDARGLEHGLVPDARNRLK